MMFLLTDSVCEEPLAMLYFPATLVVKHRWPIKRGPKEMTDHLQSWILSTVKFLPAIQNFSENIAFSCIICVVLGNLLTYCRSSSEKRLSNNIFSSPIDQKSKISKDQLAELSRPFVLVFVGAFEYLILWIFSFEYLKYFLLSILNIHLSWALSKLSRLLSGEACRVSCKLGTLHSNISIFEHLIILILGYLTIWSFDLSIFERLDFDAWNNLTCDSYLFNAKSVCSSVYFPLYLC